MYVCVCVCVCVCTNLFRYFNTNNLWVNLEELHKELVAAGGALKLPLIKNKKVCMPVCVCVCVCARAHACAMSGAQVWSTPRVFCHAWACSRTYLYVCVHVCVCVCVCVTCHMQTVNPRDSKSTPVFQLETAMGSAIECFASAGTC